MRKVYHPKRRASERSSGVWRRRPSDGTMHGGRSPDTAAMTMTEVAKTEKHTEGGSCGAYIEQHLGIFIPGCCLLHKAIWFLVFENHSYILLESLIMGTNKLNFKNIFITIYGSQEDYFNVIPLNYIIY